MRMLPGIASAQRDEGIQLGMGQIRGAHNSWRSLQIKATIPLFYENLSILIDNNGANRE
jgi:hypothetical protein